MARVYRFSGYLVDPENKANAEVIKNTILGTGMIDQQLHIQESDEFEWDEKSPIAKENCDMAELEKLFRREQGTMVHDMYLGYGRKYRHFKGKVVTVIGTAKNTETQQVEIVYMDEDERVWARPAQMFLSEVDHEKYPDVKQRFRFEEIYESRDEVEFKTKRLTYDSGEQNSCRYKLNSQRDRMIPPYGSYDLFFEITHNVIQKLGMYEEVGTPEECRKAVEESGSILLFQNEDGKWDKVPDHQLTIYFDTKEELEKFAEDLKKNRCNDPKEKYKDTSIDELDLSLRTRNCLMRGGISTIGELCERSQRSLAKIRNMGYRSIEEIENKLGTIGLSLRRVEDKNEG